MQNYIIVANRKKEGLIQDVNRYQLKGYEPVGGPFQHLEPPFMPEELCQAMWKKPAAKKAAAKSKYTPEFEEIWKIYPKRLGSNPKGKAFSAYEKRLSENPLSRTHIYDGFQSYARFCDATGKTGTEFVMQAATFLGPDRHYLNDWTVPKVQTLPRNNDDLLAFAQKNGLPQPTTGQSWADYRKQLENEIKD
jgi:hypothetical protein